MNDRNAQSDGMPPDNTPPDGEGSRSRRAALAGLLAMWPRELEDMSLEACSRLVTRLRQALRSERRRGMAGHWTYSVARHAQLARAYRAEIAALETTMRTEARRASRKAPSSPRAPRGAVPPPVSGEITIAALDLARCNRAGDRIARLEARRSRRERRTTSLW